MQDEQKSDQLVKEICDRLLYAIQTENLNLCQELLGEQDFINNKNLLFMPIAPNSRTPLAQAARLGCLEIVKELTPYYENAGAVESGCPLHVACDSGYDDRCDEVVEFLVKSFPHFVNQEDYLWKSLPIQIAAVRNNVGIVQILLNAGANVDQIVSTTPNEPTDLLISGPQYGGVTFAHHERFPALFTAIWHDSHETLECLLEHGANTVFRVQENRPRSTWTEMVLTPDNRICPFAFAAVNCCSDALSVLLDHAEMNEDAGARAVRAAVCRKDVECLVLLLENGGPTPALKEDDVDQQMIIWYAMLMPQVAPQYISIERLDMTLKRGASLDPVASLDLHLSVLLRDVHPSVFKWLLKCGLLEIRYSQHSRRKGSDACMDLKMRDSKVLVKVFTDNRQYWKLAQIINHFPLPLKFGTIPCTSHTVQIFPNREDLLNNMHVEQAAIIRHMPVENNVTLSSLLRISRWAVRSTIVTQFGYVPQDIVSELHIPQSLRKYLLHESSRPLFQHLCADDEEPVEVEFLSQQVQQIRLDENRDE